MATTTELGLLSLTHLHKLTQQQQQQHQQHNKNQNQGQDQDQDPYHHHRQDQEIEYQYLLNPNHKTTPSSSSGTSTITISSGSAWMWNPKGQGHAAEPPAEDESWEVRAFAEDTGSVMGTTWPPRSYTCAFCRREFRSAQALGGHMNVHRRDRARLHQVIPGHSSSFLSHLPPGPGPAAGGSGQLCLRYHIPPGPAGPAGPSTLLSMSMPPPYGKAGKAAGEGDGAGRRIVARRDQGQIRGDERTVEIADCGGSGEECHFLCTDFGVKRKRRKEKKK